MHLYFERIAKAPAYPANISSKKTRILLPVFKLKVYSPAKQTVVINGSLSPPGIVVMLKKSAGFLHFSILSFPCKFILFLPVTNRDTR